MLSFIVNSLLIIFVVMFLMVDSESLFIFLNLNIFTVFLLVLIMSITIVFILGMLVYFFSLSELLISIDIMSILVMFVVEIFSMNGLLLVLFSSVMDKFFLFLIISVFFIFIEVESLIL